MLQEAAGVFQYLRTRLVPRLESPQPVDLSSDSTGLLAMMCLAQVCCRGPSFALCQLLSSSRFTSVSRMVKALALFGASHCSLMLAPC